MNHKFLIERPFLQGQQEIGVGVLTEDSVAGFVPVSKLYQMMTPVLDSPDSHQNAVSSLIHYHLL